MPAAPAFGSRSALEQHQLERLRELIAALAPHNRFYAAKLQNAAGIRSLEDYCARTPFTFRRELTEDQLAHPPFGTNLTYSPERYTRFSQTSGTTGKPLHWVDTPESWRWMTGNWLRVYEAAGVTAADHIFFAFSFGPFLGFWVAFEAGLEHGCLCVPGGGLRSAGRLAAMLDVGATVLCCTPTYAIRLAEVAAAEKIDLAASKVRLLIVAGEPGGSVPGTRARLEQLWGARVVDHHGMTETGPVSYECPERPGVLHVIESSYIAEVLDPKTLEPAAPGGTGELVLTTLGRTGSPLLRYRTGDIVQRGEAEHCACGSVELALPGGILGRTDDMVVVRGVNVYPAAIENILRACDGVAEYRVEVLTTGALRELKILVEPEAGHRDAPGLVEHVKSALHTALGLRVNVASVGPGELPRFELKARRWVRL